MERDVRGRGEYDQNTMYDILKGVVKILYISTFLYFWGKPQMVDLQPPSGHCHCIGDSETNCLLKMDP